MTDARELTAVGVDHDGTVKPVNELSYAPGPASNPVPMFPEVRRSIRYASNWIDRNRYMRPKAGTKPDEHTYEYYHRAPVVCLCGSTRFFAEYQRANYELTMAGVIVLTVGHYPNAPAGEHGPHVGCTPEQKAALDDLHKEKIKLADAVAVLNVGGYVGESTRGEVLAAYAGGKTVLWLEPGKVPYDLQPHYPRCDHLSWRLALEGLKAGQQLVWYGLDGTAYSFVDGHLGIVPMEVAAANRSRMCGNGPWVFDADPAGSDRGVGPAEAPAESP